MALGNYQKARLLILAMMSLSFHQAVADSVCTDLRKTVCEDKRNCIWITGHTTSSGDKVKGYCRKTASTPSTKKKSPPSADDKSSCADLLKTTCEKKRNCSWVTGHTTGSGDRIKGYCRISSSASTTGKRKSSASTSSGSKGACSDLLKAQCDRKRTCSWVTGHTSGSGERIKGYCRKASSTGGSSRSGSSNKDGNVCTDLLKVDCERKRSCSWVSGKTDYSGKRIQGYCRKKGGSTSRSKTGLEGAINDGVMDILREMLKPQ